MHNISPVASSVSPQPPGMTDHPVSADGFRNALDELLAAEPSHEISEEELFAALVADRLAADPAAHAYFLERRAHHLAAQGSHEGATRAALTDAVEAGHLDPGAADHIYSVAFQAAQLDDDPTTLYDARGDTRAVAEAPAAAQSAGEILQRLEDGVLELQLRSLAAAGEAALAGPAPASPSGPGGGFLWKPVSESDGNLVILLPPSLRGQVERVELHREMPPSSATLIETGRFSGDTHNGGRPHFRFADPGSTYGSNVHVVAYGADGAAHTWNIPHGAERVG